MELYKGRPQNIEGRLDREVRVYDLLDSLGIEYLRTDHGHADTMEACNEIDKVLDVLRNIQSQTNARIDSRAIQSREERTIKRIKVVVRLHTATHASNEALSSLDHGDVVQIRVANVHRSRLLDGCDGTHKNGRLG